MVHGAHELPFTKQFNASKPSSTGSEQVASLESSVAGRFQLLLIGHISNSNG